jgi:hypothetical protein
VTETAQWALEAVRTSHTGDYTCTTTSVAGKTNCTAYLNVNGNTWGFSTDVLYLNFRLLNNPIKSNCKIAI